MDFNSSSDSGLEYEYGPICGSDSDFNISNSRSNSSSDSGVYFGSRSDSDTCFGYDSGSDSEFISSSYSGSETDIRSESVYSSDNACFESTFDSRFSVWFWWWLCD